MDHFFEAEGNRLIYRCDSETMYVEAWGPNALRIRAARMGQNLLEQDWALSEPHTEQAEIELGNGRASIRNGKIRGEITESGKMIFYNQDGKLLLEEFARNRKNLFSKDCSALEIEGREMRPIPGTESYALTARFESNPDEKLYGMGQYQQPFLNLKGCTLELAQRNSQASVPFLLSDQGYGFLWNNPAIGNVFFGKNLTEWKAFSTKCLDYWVTAGDTPAEIEEAYAAVTGKAPLMPDYGMGFWQCKLRYQTQEELLGVAREYKRRGIPLDVIVIDFFHWPKQGDWKFDETYWPDPDGMVRELEEMGIELMVSIWPTVDRQSENYAEMRQKGYLIRSDRGPQISMDFFGNTAFYDATNPEARKYVWSKVEQNYYNKGIRTYWLDVAEPEYSAYDYDNYRYHLGSDLQVGNLYPLMYAKTFFDGLKSNGQQEILNLLRCAWAGSQKYGALVWSGDIASSFESMRNQLAAGLNMGIAGIPWWTTDIGGFHGGDPRKEEFRELLVRWFEWGAFCPVMRLHGDREPRQPKVGTTGGADCCSGAPNEVWSYGEEVYEICRKYIGIREELRPYTARLMKEAHEKGTPVMRTLFYEFPEDPHCWEEETEYCYGPDLLVAPVMEAGQRSRAVYLPAGSQWEDYETGQRYAGGNTYEVDAPIDKIPVFKRVR